MVMRDETWEKAYNQVKPLKIFFSLKNEGKQLTVSIACFLYEKGDQNIHSYLGREKREISS